MGETEYAAWGLAVAFVGLPFLLGKPMKPIIESCNGVHMQTEDLEQYAPTSYVQGYWQAMLLLQKSGSGATSPLQLEGSILERSKYLESNSLTNSATATLMEGFLSLFSGDYEAAAKRALKVGDVFLKQTPGAFYFQIEKFHRALSLYAGARKAGKRQFRTAAKKLRKAIRKWEEAGNPNVIQYNLLFTAEQAALVRNDKVALPKGHCVCCTLRTSAPCCLIQ